MNGLTRSLKWALFSIVALWLCWRIITVNVAQHLVQEESAMAAAWAPQHAQVLLLQAAQQASHAPQAALELALRAARANPTDSRPAILAALVWEQQGRTALAEGAMRLADLLTPRRTASQLQIANFWARRGRIDQALPHWSVVLQMRPALRDTLFPVLLRLAEIPQYRPAFSGIMRDPPAWWDGFFRYALANAASMDTLKALYQARAESPNGIGQQEHKAYLDYLQRNGLWGEAYFVWLNRLDPKQMAVLGNLYDGGFELEAADLGYGWRLGRDDGFLVINEPTYGAVGAKALRVAYNGRQPRTTLLAAQYLLLDPGRYKLHGRVRLDNLAAGDGLRWSVACVRGGELTHSETFAGIREWRPFSVELEVPESGCEAQQLMLAMTQGPDKPLLYSGSAWFDALYIEKRF